MNCKDCINYEVCLFWQEIINGLIAEYSDTRVNGIDGCLMFKDKSKIRELPELGCEFCNTYDFARSRISFSYGVGIQFAQCNTKFKKEEQFKYCPNCGRKLGADNG